MTNVSIKPSIDQYKSDIFFTRDAIQSPKRELREFKSPERVEMKFPEISDYPRQLFSPQINRRSDKLHSDIFNFSNTNHASPKPAKTVKKVATNIFLGDAKPEIVKKDKSKVAYDPAPYFSKATAASRRLIELYGEKTLKTHKITVENNMKQTRGTLEREKVLNDPNRGKQVANPLLTARQRKLLAHQSSLEVKEAKGITNQLNNAKINEKIPQSSHPQEKRLNDMRSNIFHDPNKGNIYEAFSPRRKQDLIKDEKEEKEEKKVPPKVSKFSKNIWKPVEEREEDSNQNLSNKNNEAKITSSLGTNLKHLEGNITTLSEKNVNVIKKTDQVAIPAKNVKKEEESIKNDLRSNLKETLKIDNAKLKKKLDLSSTNQGSEFYQKNAKPVKNSDLSFQKFEIKDVPNISTNIREIELIFRKKG